MPDCYNTPKTYIQYFGQHQKVVSNKNITRPSNKRVSDSVLLIWMVCQLADCSFSLPSNAMLVFMFSFPFYSPFSLLRTWRRDPDKLLGIPNCKTKSMHNSWFLLFCSGIWAHYWRKNVEHTYGRVYRMLRACYYFTHNEPSNKMYTTIFFRVMVPTSLVFFCSTRYKKRRRNDNSREGE